ncbi:helix-turn-helix domain-containing protein [Lacisediminimonas profundi]|uniref:helix-turn-helix domain-containing protein n=1 Tax=Lacisediminimonas profundi TaxID=2603856 RepID=UPI001386F31C|nr:helix-turn-helix domain-containing protein [Lacisediminimonas profundi]
MDELKAAKAQSAETKLRTGALLDIQEVAAKLDVSHSTVHRLPLPSIRIGKQLRFDPKDVQRLIEAGREPIAA